MNHTRSLILLTALLLYLTSASAQSYSYPVVAGPHGALLSFRQPSGSFVTPAQFAYGMGVSAAIRLADPLALTLGGGMFPVARIPVTDTSVAKGLLADGTLGLRLTGAGLFMDEDAGFSPYLSTGFGVTSGIAGQSLYLPATLGVRLRAGESSSFNLEGTYRYTPSTPEFSYLAIQVGLSLAVVKSKTPRPDKADSKTESPVKMVGTSNVTDSDGDGIPDEEDKCPDEQGLVHHNGCPMPKAETGAGGNNQTTGGSAKPGTTPNKTGDKTGDVSLKVGQGTAEEQALTAPVGAKTMVGKRARNIAREDSVFLEMASGMVQFVEGSDQLTPASIATLDKIAALMVKYPNSRLHVSGHTDNTLDTDAALVLSVKRGYNVKYYFVKQKGIRMSRITSDGYGSDMPLGDNNTPEGRKRNNRVEFDLFNEL